MSFATAPDGTRLYYERFTPPVPTRPLPIVLIAGWAANGRLWSPAVERGLKAGYETITTDSRGTGRSGAWLAPVSAAMLAADAARVLDDRGLRSAHVLGVSMGAEYRREHLDFAADFVQASGQLNGAGGASPPVNGGYDVYELFGEARVPLVQGCLAIVQQLPRQRPPLLAGPAAAG